MSRHRPAVAAIVAALALSGCGLPQRVVGIHPAPAQASGSLAPLAVDRARAIAARVQAAAADAATPAQQDAALVGPALRSARAAATVAAAVATAATPAATPAPTGSFEPSSLDVLAISSSRAWPRAILASSLDETTGTARLHVYRSDAAAEPYRLCFTATMPPAAMVPSLGVTAEGVALVDPEDATGLPASPREVFSAYAGTLTYPKPTASAWFVGDELTAGLSANAAAQVKALGALGSFTRTQEVVPDSLLGFRLAGGGALVVGQLVRTDTITLTSKAKELPLPEPYAAVAGRSSLTSTARIVVLENIALVVPATGAVSLVGASEQLESVTGS